MEQLTFDPPEETLSAAGRFKQIHTLTFPEVITSVVPIVDAKGDMWGGPDRKIWNVAQANEIWLAWQRAVQEAAKGELFKQVPHTVHEYFQATKKYNKAPEEMLKLLNLEGGKLIDVNPHCSNKEATMANVLTSSAVSGINITQEQIENYIGSTHTTGSLGSEKTNSTEGTAPAKPKFSWSFTGLDVFFNICARKFAARWFYKTEIFEANPTSIWGNRKHKADELALKELEFEIVKGQKIICEKEIVDWKYVNAFLAAKNAGARLLVEEEIAFDRGLKRVAWFDKTAWGRAKIDVALIKDDTIKIYDWKTGKEKYDEWQLRIFCLFAALAYPQIQHFEARFIWLQEDKVSDAIILTRTEILPILKDTLAKVARIEQAWNDEIFQCRQNGLCKRYCGVLDCPHHGGKK